MRRKAIALVGCLITALVWTHTASAAEQAGVADKETQGDALEGKKADRVAVGLEGVELEELENDYTPDIKRLVIPPYYQETSDRLKLRFVFPLFFSRERIGKGARSDLGILPFYWRYREGKDRSADVVFPFYWRFRGPHFKTDIVLQTYYNRSDHGYNFGFAPLVFAGKDSRDNSSYQVILPPLFWRTQKGDSSLLYTSLLYYDRKNRDDYHRGLLPLFFFAGREHYKSYLVILPPLFWRFKDEIAYTTKNVLPPFFYNTREHGWSFGMMPLLYLARDKEWDRTLVAPFYYGSRWQHKDETGEALGEGRSHYFPLLLSYYRHAPGLSQGGAAVFYHWYWNRGEYLKMFSPLVWLYGNEYTDDRAALIPPLFYHRKSPVRRDVMAGLVYWNFHDFHKKHTLAIAPLFSHTRTLYEDRWRTWVFPTFDFGSHPDGYHARLHPLFYLGKDLDSDHLVIAPVVWKFKDKEDDDLVVFPLYWGFNDLEHDDSQRVVFPFWWQFDDRRKQRFNRVVFPFYWDSGQPTGAQEEHRCSTVVLEKQESLSLHDWGAQLCSEQRRDKGKSLLDLQDFPIARIWPSSGPGGRLLVRARRVGRLATAGPDQRAQAVLDTL